jgi:uncharacterized membrane protein YeaQ/YmgE (transglycosylase-associated protein family)
MFYSIWLLAAALAGWAGGKIAGDDGFGTLADIFLGITGAFVVRWSLENIGISLKDVYLLLFSIWGPNGRLCPRKRHAGQTNLMRQAIL